MNSPNRCALWLLLAVTTLWRSVLPAAAADSSPRDFCTVGNQTFFSASDLLGRQLWVTDGTGAGTRMVPGAYWGAYGPGDLTALGNQCFFVAMDMPQGQGLWKSDGTQAGTMMVKNIAPGTSYTQFSNLVVMGGSLYFSASSLGHSQELWKSDGTEAGTVMVKDIAPGDMSSWPDHLTVMDGVLYFAASETEGHRGLWKSDGTEAGTVLVKDIEPVLAAGQQSYIYDMRPSGGLLYFAAGEPTHGLELWRSDGTEAGTFMVKDLYPGTIGNYASGGAPMSLTAMGGLLYFTAVDGQDGARKLWRTDGTADGTKRMTTGGGITPNIHDTGLIVFNNELYFSADAPNTADPRLWKSDGTEAGTNELATVSPGFSFDSSGTAPAHFAIAGGFLYFAGYSAGGGGELWKTDGTPTGTVQVKDIRPGLPYSSPTWLTALGDRVVFNADSTHGREPWISDGTDAGTMMLKNIQPENGITRPDDIAVMDDVAYYTWQDSNSVYLSRDDGSGADPVRLLAMSTGTYYPIGSVKLKVVNHALYFFTTDSINGLRMWTSNGTIAGTKLVTAFTANGRPVFEVQPQNLTVSGGRLYFTLQPGNFPNPSSPPGLWQSDGTAAGTSLIVPGSARMPYNLTAADGLLYFTMGGEWVTDEIWRTDGTAAGTYRVAALPVTDSFGYNTAGYSTLAVSQSRLYFVQQNGPAVTVWTVVDSGPDSVALKLLGFTQPGSSLLASLAPTPLNVRLLGGRLLFSANDSANGEELWTSNGTVLGTKLLKDIKPGPTWITQPTSFTVAGGILFFTANNGVNGTELWKSDGTAAGTVMVKDIYPGDAGSKPLNLSAVGRTVYFGADDGVHGLELWKSDGTAAGTVLVEDIPNNGTGSVPGQFVRGTNKLYYTALTPPSGYALHSLALTAPKAVTKAATNVNFAEAQLNGLVNPSGGAAIWRFDYGLTSNYGRTTSWTGGALLTGSTLQPVNTTLTGLAPGTVYHYRLVAEVEGEADGADMTFTTGYSHDSTIAGLTFSAGVTEGPLGGTDLHAQFRVPTTTTSTTVTATSSVFGGYATVRVNGTVVPFGKPSGPIALVQGYNRVEVQVTADDGRTTTTYTVDVLREPLNARFETPFNPVGESEESVSVVVSLSDVAPRRITVPYSLEAGPGLVLKGPNADVTVPAGPLVFMPGEQFKKVTILVHNDQRHEDTEQLLLLLGAPTGGAMLGQSVAVVEIQDDDDLPVVALSPARQLIATHSPLVLNATVTSKLPVTYAWKLNDKVIPGARSPVYFVADAALVQAGTYTVTVTSNAGAAVATAAVGVVDTTQHTMVPAQAGPQPPLTQLAAGNNLVFTWRRLVPGATPTPLTTSVASKGLLRTATAYAPGRDTYACTVTMNGLPNVIVTGGFTFFSYASAKPAVPPAALPPGKVGLYYNESLNPSGAVRGTWAASGLPAGLSIDPTNGMVRGYPQATVTVRAIKVSVTNAFGTTAMVPSPLLTITAQFAGVAGTWNGLLERRTTVNGDLGSRVELTVTTLGTYTGKIITGTVSQPVKGLVGVTGIGANGVAVAGDTVYYTADALKHELKLAFNTADNPPKLRGSMAVTSLATPVTTEVAALNGWRSMEQPASQAGRYSFALTVQPPDDTNLERSLSTGFGVATVTAAGKVTYVGKTGDGTSFTSACTVGSSSECVLYTSLYGGRGTLMSVPKIQLAGSLPLLADTSFEDTDSLPTTWNKQVDTSVAGSTHYPGGWPVMTLSLRGSRYLVPAATEVVMGLQYTPRSTNMRLSFEGIWLAFGNEGAQDMALKPNGTIEPLSAAENPLKLAITVTPGTGAFSGSWIHKDWSYGYPDQKVTFQGQIVRFVTGTPQYQGVGIFLLPQPMFDYPTYQGLVPKPPLSLLAGKVLLLPIEPSF